MNSILCRVFLAGCAVFALSACQSLQNNYVYKIDVAQGNVVTQDMVAQLKAGMTRDQARFVLGTPLLEDVFHANRWDYIYRLKEGNGTLSQRRLTLFFENDLLARVQGDVVASAPPTADEPAKPATQVIDLGSVDVKAEDAPPAEKKGFFGRMLEKVGL